MFISGIEVITTPVGVLYTSEIVHSVKQWCGVIPDNDINTD